MLRVRTAALWWPETWTFSKFINNLQHNTYQVLSGANFVFSFLNVFSYMIAQGVCYLLLCEASFPKKMAFAYLEDLHTEFFDQYGRKVPTVTRPYSFIEFGKTVHDVLVCLKMVEHFFRKNIVLFQTRTSRKTRRHTLTAEPDRTWAASTQSYRMFRG